MTAQNLPHEPEFEQAYKGMSSIVVPLQYAPSDVVHGTRSIPHVLRAPPDFILFPAFSASGSSASGSANHVSRNRARLYPRELHSFPEEA